MTGVNAAFCVGSLGRAGVVGILGMVFLVGDGTAGGPVRFGLGCARRSMDRLMSALLWRRFVSALLDRDWGDMVAAKKSIIW